MPTRKLDEVRFRQMYRAGCSYREIMDALGITSRSTLKSARRRLKLRARSCGWHRITSQARWAAIETRIRQGWDNARIRKDLKVSNEIIARARKYMPKGCGFGSGRDSSGVGPYGQQIQQADRWAALL